MTSTLRTTEEMSQFALAAVEREYEQYVSGDSAPKVIERWGLTTESEYPSVVWEDGPEGWAITMSAKLNEFVRTDDSAPRVFVEPVMPYALGIYPHTDDRSSDGFDGAIALFAKLRSQYAASANYYRKTLADDVLCGSSITAFDSSVTSSLISSEVGLQLASKMITALQNEQDLGKRIVREAALRSYLTITEGAMRSAVTSPNSHRVAAVTGFMTDSAAIILGL